MQSLWQQYEQVVAPLRPHLPWIFTASIVMSIVGLLLIPVVAIAIPSDYFVRPLKIVPPSSQHPVLRWSLFIIRGGVGGLMIVVGMLLLFLPGNGMLLILVGLMIVDFKWKRRWLRRLIRRKSIHGPINWLRAKAGRLAVELPKVEVDSTSETRCRVGV